MGVILILYSLAMCQLAVDESSDWLMIDPWEALHKEYQPTAVVLDHIDHEINVVRQGVDCGDGTRKQVRVALLAGADLIHTMSTPGVWSDKDLDHILGRYGVSLVSYTVYAILTGTRHSSSSEAALISMKRWPHYNPGATISTLSSNSSKTTLAAPRSVYS